MATAPASAMPCRNPRDSFGPDGRLSRPTAMVGARPIRSHTTLAKARPSARANSGVSSRSTMPRTSYWRKIDFGTFIGASLSREGKRELRQALHAPNRYIEQLARPHAKQQECHDRDRDHAERRGGQLDVAIEVG